MQLQNPVCKLIRTGSNPGVHLIRLVFTSPTPLFQNSLDQAELEEPLDQTEREFLNQVEVEEESLPNAGGRKQAKKNVKTDDRVECLVRHSMVNRMDRHIIRH